MDPADGAEIIPFPQRTAAPVSPSLSAPTAEDADRVGRSVAALQHALAEQRLAIAAWQDALAQLRASTRRLGDGLGAYQRRLDALRGQVGTLNESAAGLESWADDQLRHEPPSA